MAEFSKEYCEKHMPDWPYDFSIEEEAKTIGNDNFRYHICEGYGFIAIANINGDIFLAFRDNAKLESNEVSLIAYSQLDEYHEQKIKSN